jgi:hypothetical protein
VFVWIACLRDWTASVESRAESSGPLGKHLGMLVDAPKTCPPRHVVHHVSIATTASRGEKASRITPRANLVCSADHAASFH